MWSIKCPDRGWLLPNARARARRANEVSEGTPAKRRGVGASLWSALLGAVGPESPTDLGPEGRILRKPGALDTNNAEALASRSLQYNPALQAPNHLGA